MPKDKPPLPEADSADAPRVDRRRACPGNPASRSRRTDYEPPLRPRRPELPPAVDGRDNPIDRILDAYLQRARQAATRRRSTTPRSSAACTSTSSACCPRPTSCTPSSPTTTRPSASKLVDELLADNGAYAEHWLSFWNDLLRNDYAGTGYIDGGRKQISAWLYRALLEQHAVRRVRPRADRAAARVGRLHQGHRVARRGERQPEAASCSSPRTCRRCSWAST